MNLTGSLGLDGDFGHPSTGRRRRRRAMARLGPANVFAGPRTAARPGDCQGPPDPSGRPAREERKDLAGGAAPPGARLPSVEGRPLLLPRQAGFSEPSPPRGGMSKSLTLFASRTAFSKQGRPLGDGNALKSARKQHCAVDHLARGSMKNAANCASECELQDT